MSVRIFFKIDVLAIRERRLISKVGADGWATLCAIASFMDEDGVCYPTQETLADLMGVTRQAANARIGRLLKITMEDGSPLLERSWKGHGLSKRSVYRINKACGVFMGRELDMSDDAPGTNVKSSSIVKDRRHSRPIRCKDSLTSNATITDVTLRNESGHKEEPKKEESDAKSLEEEWKNLFGKEDGLQ
jgi:hypothetical protein